MGGGGMHDPFDIFSSFFGGGGGGMGGRARGPRKGEDVVHALKCSLEDFYSGSTRKLSVSKNILCPQCDGSGAKSGQVTRCTSCNGQGVKLQIRQLGPGMLQQVQSVCEVCRGEVGDVDIVTNRGAVGRWVVGAVQDEGLSSACCAQSTRDEVGLWAVCLSESTVSRGPCSVEESKTGHSPARVCGDPLSQQRLGRCF